MSALPDQGVRLLRGIVEKAKDINNEVVEEFGGMSVMDTPEEDEEELDAGMDVDE